MTTVPVPSLCAIVAASNARSVSHQSRGRRCRPTCRHRRALVTRVRLPSSWRLCRFRRDRRQQRETVRRVAEQVAVDQHHRDVACDVVAQPARAARRHRTADSFARSGARSAAKAWSWLTGKRPFPVLARHTGTLTTDDARASFLAADHIVTHRPDMKLLERCCASSRSPSQRDAGRCDAQCVCGLIDSKAPRTPTASSSSARRHFSDRVHVTYCMATPTSATAPRTTSCCMAPVDYHLVLNPDVELAPMRSRRRALARPSPGRRRPRAAGARQRGPPRVPASASRDRSVPAPASRRFLRRLSPPRPLRAARPHGRRRRT